MRQNNNTNTKNKSNSRQNGSSRKGKARNIREKKRKYDSCLDKRDGSLDESTNDVSWYAKDPALLRDAASIPFSWATGTAVDLNNPFLTRNLNSDGKFTVPGIMRLRTATSVGWSSDPSSPVNVAATALYGWVRYANSGSKNYDSVDLMLYVMAMTQVYAYINWAQRIYGVSSLYSQRNRYLGRALLSAMDCDYNDIVSNQANLRYGINVLINKIGSLAVPADMPIVAREAFMHSNIYIEGESMKDQLYLTVPHGFYFFELDDDGAGKLKLHTVGEFTTTPNSGLTVDDILTLGNKLLDPIIKDEDMNIMSGDILKAYGNNILKLTSLPEVYPIVPIYDPVVLNQFKNATVVFRNRISGLEITQDATKAFLEHKPTLQFKGEWQDEVWQGNAFTAIAESYLQDRVLTVNSTDPDPGLIMESTRLMFGCGNFQRSGQSTTANTSIASCEIYSGSDIVTSVEVYFYLPGTGTGELELNTLSMCYINPYFIGDKPDDIVQQWMVNSLISCFKYHPYSLTIVAKAGDTPGTFSISNAFSVFDVDNYAVMTGQMVSKLNETALLSLWNVPVIGKV